MIVYIPMCADLFHVGHLRAIIQCAKHGEVVVGLVDNHAYKKVIIPYEQRKEILEAIPEVKMVVKQDGLDFSKNAERVKADFVASGDGWEEIELEAFKGADCRPLDISYCEEQSTTKIKKKIYEQTTQD